MATHGAQVIQKAISVHSTGLQKYPTHDNQSQEAIAKRALAMLTASDKAQFGKPGTASNCVACTRVT